MWVYFIQDGDKGPIKIGFSTNLEARMAQLQTSTHRKLKLLGKVEGTQRLEHDIHRHLAAHRLEGEWFTPSSEVLETINQILHPTRPPIIYFAGKVRKKGGYRFTLIGYDDVMSGGHREYKIDGQKVIYGGPFALSCDHGCWHRPGTHGWNSEASCPGDFRDDPEVFAEFRSDRDLPSDHSREYVTREICVQRCLDQIRDCDAVHAYIDSLDCFGTLAEIGFACAMRKVVSLTVAESLRLDAEDVPQDENFMRTFDPPDELWFIKNLPGVLWEYGPETYIRPSVIQPVPDQRNPWTKKLRSFP